MSQASATARDYAGRTTESLRDSARFAAGQFHEGVEGAQALIYDYPGRALAICFGIGLLAGWAISMTCRASVPVCQWRQRKCRCNKRPIVVG